MSQQAEQVSLFSIGQQLFLADFSSSHSQLNHLETWWEMDPTALHYNSSFSENVFTLTPKSLTLFNAAV